jgi:hypothetical protein
MSSETLNVIDPTPAVQKLTDEITQAISAAIFAGASPDDIMRALVYALAFAAGHCLEGDTATFIEDFGRQLPKATEIAELFRAALVAESMAHVVEGTETTQ